MGEYKTYNNTARSAIEYIQATMKDVHKKIEDEISDAEARIMEYIREYEGVAVTVTENENCDVALTVGGQAVESGTNVLKGSDVTITATPDEGYRFIKFTIAGTDNDENPATIEGITTATTVTSTVSQEFAITAQENEHCAISVTDVAKENEEVEVTVAPEDGYVIDSITANEEACTQVTENEKYKFTMPGEDVEVAVTVTVPEPPEPSEP